MVSESRIVKAQNLHPDVTESSLRAFLNENCGRVHRIEFGRASSSGCRNAYVTFTESRAAVKATAAPLTVRDHRCRFEMAVETNGIAAERRSQESNASTGRATNGSAKKDRSNERRSSGIHRERSYRNHRERSPRRRGRSPDHRRRRTPPTGAVQKSSSPRQSAAAAPSSKSSRASSRSSQSSTASHKSAGSGSRKQPVVESSPRSARRPSSSTGVKREPGVVSGAPMASTSSGGTPASGGRVNVIAVHSLPSRSTDDSIKHGLYHKFKKLAKVVVVKVAGDGDDRMGLITLRRYTDVQSVFDQARTDELFLGHKVKFELMPPGYDVNMDDNERRPLIKDFDEYHSNSSRTLYVGNLDNRQLSKDRLREMFVPFGNVLDVDIKNSNTPAPFAFVQFSDIQSVVKAIHKLDQGYMGGNKIKVRKLGFGKSLPTGVLWIDDLPAYVTNNQLLRKMQFYGQVRDVAIDLELGQALVFFESIDNATRAVQDLKSRKMSSRRVQADFASRELQDVFLDRLEDRNRYRNTPAAPSTKVFDSYLTRDLAIDRLLDPLGLPFSIESLIDSRVLSEYERRRRAEGTRDDSGARPYQQQRQYDNRPRSRGSYYDSLQIGRLSPRDRQTRHDRISLSPPYRSSHQNNSLRPDRLSISPSSRTHAPLDPKCSPRSRERRAALSRQHCSSSSPVNSTQQPRIISPKEGVTQPRIPTSPVSPATQGPNSPAPEQLTPKPHASRSPVRLSASGSSMRLSRLSDIATATAMEVAASAAGQKGEMQQMQLLRQSISSSSSSDDSSTSSGSSSSDEDEKPSTTKRPGSSRSKTETKEKTTPANNVDVKEKPKDSADVARSMPELLKQKEQLLHLLEQLDTEEVTSSIGAQKKRATERLSEILQVNTAGLSKAALVAKTSSSLSPGLYDGLDKPALITISPDQGSEEKEKDGGEEEGVPRPVPPPGEAGDKEKTGQEGSKELAKKNREIPLERVDKHILAKDPRMDRPPKALKFPPELTLPAFAHDKNTLARLQRIRQLSADSNLHANSSPSSSDRDMQERRLSDSAFSPQAATPTGPDNPYYKDIFSSPNNPKVAGGSTSGEPRIIPYSPTNTGKRPSLEERIKALDQKFTTLEEAVKKAKGSETQNKLAGSIGVPQSGFVSSVDYTKYTIKRKSAAAPATPTGSEPSLSRQHSSVFEHDQRRLQATVPPLSAPPTGIPPSFDRPPPSFDAQRVTSMAPLSVVIPPVATSHTQPSSPHAPPPQQPGLLLSRRTSLNPTMHDYKPVAAQPPPISPVPAHGILKRSTLDPRMAASQAPPPPRSELPPVTVPPPTSVPPPRPHVEHPTTSSASSQQAPPPAPRLDPRARLPSFGRSPLDRVAPPNSAYSRQMSQTIDLQAEQQQEPKAIKAADEVKKERVEEQEEKSRKQSVTSIRSESSTSEKQPPRDGEGKEKKEKKKREKSKEEEKREKKERKAEKKAEKLQRKQQQQQQQHDSTDGHVTADGTDEKPAPKKRGRKKRVQQKYNTDSSDDSENEERKAQAGLSKDWQEALAALGDEPLQGLSMYDRVKRRSTQRNENPWLEQAEQIRKFKDRRTKEGRAALGAKTKRRRVHVDDESSADEAETTKEDVELEKPTEDEEDKPAKKRPKLKSSSDADDAAEEEHLGKRRTKATQKRRGPGKPPKIQRLKEKMLKKGRKKAGRRKSDGDRRLGKKQDVSAKRSAVIKDEDSSSAPQSPVVTVDNEPVSADIVAALKRSKREEQEQREERRETVVVGDQVADTVEIGGIEETGAEEPMDTGRVLTAVEEMSAEESRNRPLEPGARPSALLEQPILERLTLASPPIATIVPQDVTTLQVRPAPEMEEPQSQPIVPIRPQPVLPRLPTPTAVVVPLQQQQPSVDKIIDDIAHGYVEIDPSELRNPKDDHVDAIVREIAEGSQKPPLARPASVGPTQPVATVAPTVPLPAVPPPLEVSIAAPTAFHPPLPSPTMPPSQADLIRRLQQQNYLGFPYAGTDPSQDPYLLSHLSHLARRPTATTTPRPPSPSSAVGLYQFPAGFAGVWPTAGVPGAGVAVQSLAANLEQQERERAALQSARLQESAAAVRQITAAQSTPTEQGGPSQNAFQVLVRKYPIVWQGNLALKNDASLVQMHFITGNRDLPHLSLPTADSSAETVTLRINQRMRLDEDHLDGVARRMQSPQTHSILLALPCGRDQGDIYVQSSRLQTAFIQYLQEKLAAGIVNVFGPQDTTTPVYVVHIFPPCEFAQRSLLPIAEDFHRSVQERQTPYLFIVVATS